MNIKTPSYNKFKCIGDKCKYTCCSGWNIEVDSATLKLWESIDTNLVKGAKKVNGEYFINKNTSGTCPFLDKVGLCNIIKEKGDSFIPKGCQSFPRVENKIGEMVEHSINLACIEGVNLIYKDENPFMIPKVDELIFRNTITEIIEKKDVSLDEKLTIAYKITVDSFACENTKKYTTEEFINRLKDEYENIEFDINEGIVELNNFFKDIIKNYKRVPIFRELLGGLTTFVRNEDLEYLSLKWGDFKKEFSKHDDFILNVIKNKIYSNCSMVERYENELSFGLITLEYILFRYATFLYWFSEGYGEINVEVLKEFIMAFSRIVLNNRESMLGFLEDEFGDELIDFGYIEGMLLF